MTQAEKIKDLESRIDEFAKTIEALSKDSERKLSSKERDGLLKELRESAKEAFKNLSKEDFEDENFQKYMHTAFEALKESNYYKKKLKESLKKKEQQDEKIEGLEEKTAELEESIDQLKTDMKHFLKKIALLEKADTSESSQCCILAKREPNGTTPETKYSYYNGSAFAFMSDFKEAKRFENYEAANRCVKELNEVEKEISKHNKKRHIPLLDVEVKFLSKK